MKQKLLQLSLCFLVLLSACKKNTTETSSTSGYAVTFEGNGSTSGVPANLTGVTEVTAAQATTPVKTNFRFDGWYKEVALTNLATFPLALTANTTLYAKWTATATYTVTFNTNGGTSISAQSITSGGQAVYPTEPTKTDCVFDGWFSNEGLTQPFLFLTAITSNITLYAKFTQLVTVTFNTNGGTVVATQKVRNNTPVVDRPYNPTKTDFIFSGWYSDAGLTNAFSFSTAITSNITLYAKFVSKFGTAVIGGKSYKTVIVGTQTWMAENLNYDTVTGHFAQPHSDRDSATKYGLWYQWPAANDADTKIAGWHLPSNADWKTLSDFLGGDLVSGGKMKVGGSSGFDALLAGYKDNDANGYDNVGYFWSATVTGLNYYVFYVNSTIELKQTNHPSDNLLSVRLVKD